MDTSLTPDERAQLLVEQMTLDEKIQLVHGSRAGGTGQQAGDASRSLGGAGFIAGIPRLGIPDMQMADGPVGLARGGARSRYSTALPATMAETASWDLDLAYLYGSILGQEAHDQGFTLLLAGGANLATEPRNGRNFEYKSEDPILAGKMVGQEMKAVGERGVIPHTKHYAFNNQETGRNVASSNVDERTMRETELLAFEIAIKDGGIGAVMCAYNRINGDYACENDYLLNEVLKEEWGFQGFVLSDWGATHSTTKAVMAGLDIEMPGSTYLGDALKEAVENGEVPVERLDDMIHRILRTVITAGQLDNPPSPQVVDVFAGFEVAQRVAEEGSVLLKNADGQLPLNASQLRSIAVIGSHSDVGVLSGGGSSQVNPPGGNAVVASPAQGGQGPGGGFGRTPTYYKSSPLKAIQTKVPEADVEYDEGTDVAAAAALAESSDVAIVFVNQYRSEGRDVESLSLPDGQDGLVRAVAAANPHTIVVLETGGAVLMPWVGDVAAVLEVWYPGIRGADAIANLLFGDANPSGKLPITFPVTEADLAHPVLQGPPPQPAAQAAAPASGGPGGRQQMQPFDVDYSEGLKIGYKWFDAEGKEPLFAFGYGLSYTTFSYSDLQTSASGDDVTVSFQITNTGDRTGAEIAQVYVGMPENLGEPPKRLVAWDKVSLEPGESTEVSLPLDPLHLSVFDADNDQWRVAPGDYEVFVGGSSRDMPLAEAFSISD